MMALLRNDARWLFAALLLGSGVFCAVTWSTDPDLNWIAGGLDRHWEDILIAWWAGAFLLGLYAGARERLFGTREYLLHRPISATRIFWTRCAACIAVMAMAVIVPHVIQWIVPPGRWANKAIWTWDAGLSRWIVAATMLPLFALGVWAATQRCSLLVVLCKLGLVGVPVAYMSLRLMWPLGEGHAVSSPFYVVAQATLAGVLLWLAAVQFREGPDADRTLPAPARWGFGGLLAITCGGLVLLAVAEGQREAHRALRGHLPWIVESPGGQFQLVRRRWSGMSFTSRPVDEDHQIQAEAAPLATKAIVGAWMAPAAPFPNAEDTLLDRAWRSPAIGSRWVRLTIPHWYAAGGNSQLAAWLRLPEGRVYAYRIPWARPRLLLQARQAAGEATPEHKTARSWTLARGDGRPFGSTCVWNHRGPTRIYDPEDRTLWILRGVRTDAPHFEHVALPGGERFERFARGSRRAESPGGEPMTRHHDLVVTDGGVYEVEAGALRAADMTQIDEDPFRRPTRSGSAAVGELRTVDADPLAARVELRGGKGAKLFEHTFRPRLPGEHLLSLATQGFAVVRPPLCAVASIGAPEPLPFPLDLLIARGRTRLALYGLCLSVLLAWLTHRRLARWGATPSGRRMWALLVLLGGLGLYVAFWLVERRRAHAPVHVRSPDDLAPVLIASP